jgi:thymidylate synthase (FAD)
LSQRYSDPTDVLSKLSEKCWDFDLRAQDILNRQNSLPYPNEDVKKDMKKEIREVYDSIDALYSRMLELGFAKECARNILPMCSPDPAAHAGNFKRLDFLRRFACTP